MRHVGDPPAQGGQGLGRAARRLAQDEGYRARVRQGLAAATSGAEAADPLARVRRLNHYLATGLDLGEEDDVTSSTPLPWQQQPPSSLLPLAQQQQAASDDSSEEDSDIDDAVVDVASLAQAAQQAVEQRQRAAAAALTIQRHFRRHRALLLACQLRTQKLARERLVARIIGIAYTQACGKQRRLARQALGRRMRWWRRCQWRNKCCRLNAADADADADADAAQPAAPAAQEQCSRPGACRKEEQVTARRAAEGAKGMQIEAAADASLQSSQQQGASKPAAAEAQQGAAAPPRCSTSSCQTDEGHAVDGAAAAALREACREGSGRQACTPPTVPASLPASRPAQIAAASASASASTSAPQRVATPPPPAAQLSTPPFEFPAQPLPAASMSPCTTSTLGSIDSSRGSTGVVDQQMQHPQSWQASSPYLSRCPTTGSSSSSSGRGGSTPYRSPGISPPVTAGGGGGQQLTARQASPRCTATPGDSYGRRSSSGRLYRRTSSIQLLEAVQLGIDGSNGGGSVASQAALEVCERTEERARELQQSASIGRPPTAGAGGRISRVASRVQRQGSRAAAGWAGAATIQE